MPEGPQANLDDTDLVSNEFVRRFLSGTAKRNLIDYIQTKKNLYSISRDKAQRIYIKVLILLENEITTIEETQLINDVFLKIFPGISTHQVQSSNLQNLEAVINNLQRHLDQLDSA